MKTITKGLAAVLASSALLLTACGGTGETTATSESTKADAASGNAITVTDVEGRTVTFDKLPERVILSEGRGVFATSILDREHPLDKVVGMGNDLEASAPSYYDNFKKSVPELADVTTIGNMNHGDVTVENLLALNPDVVVMSADAYKTSGTNGLLQKLDDVKIKYVVTDFRQHPLENTTKSVEMLGTVLGKEDKAKEFTKEWTDKVNSVKERVEKLNDRPSTFLWRAAGLKECCSTVNDSNLGEMINVAGGDNLGDHLVDGPSGSVTAEQLIASQPAAIIATGGSWAPDKDKPEVVPHVELGYNSDPETAQKTLQGLLATPGFEELKAPKDDEFFAVWHQFYDSPLNYIAIEQFAKWLHPDEFKDLDPEKDLKEAHKKYVAFDATGVFFVKDDQK